MSLLLEALKKAEKAKEEAQRRARSTDGAAPADPDATVLDDGRRVMTRDELPDISAPLEILSDDLRAAEPSRQPLDLDRAPAPEPAPARREPVRPPASSVTSDERPAASASAPASAPASAERAAAKKVFEAKFREPNPKLPFYITMAVLGVACVGTAVYFYIQLRPPPPLVNTNPQRPKEEKAVVADTPATPAKAPAAPSTPAAIPGLPDNPGAPGTNVPAAASAAPQAAAAQAPAVPATPAQPAKPAAATSMPAQAAPVAPAKPAAAQATTTRPAASPRADDARATPPGSAPRGAARAAPSQPKTEEQALSVNRGGPQVHPQVTSGYAAYQAGDLARARNDYLQALREEPANRDALLGIAAVEMRAQRYDLADGYYARLLQIDPRDPHAQAGMLALRGQQLDPVAVESRVKSMLAANPDAIALHFTLGNQYAQQGRWAEAQQAYFRAFASDPENADIAYNLAVSLDQLNQPKPALEYYRRALSLAERRGASFPTELARTRVQQLSR